MKSIALALLVMAPVIAFSGEVLTTTVGNINTLTCWVSDGIAVRLISKQEFNDYPIDGTIKVLRIPGINPVKYEIQIGALTIASCDNFTASFKNY